MRPTIQVSRTAPVTQRHQAAALLERIVAAGTKIAPLEELLWDYGDGCGTRGLDLLRALKHAETLGGWGELLGWNLRAATPDKSIELAFSLDTEPIPGCTSVFTLKLVDGTYLLDQLAEHCELMMDAFDADSGVVSTPEGVVLQSCDDDVDYVAGILRSGTRSFRVLQLV